jgi:hypothetical protein
MSRTSRTSRMSRMTRGNADHAAHDLLEHRLRAALDARVRTVELDALRRASPPSLQARTVRFPTRAATLALIGLAAVLACVLLVPWEGRQPEPVPPAHPSVTHSPRPTRTGEATARPEPARPDDAPPAAPDAPAVFPSSAASGSYPAVPVPGSR